METAITIIKQLLTALLKLFELFVAFVVGALNLILDFARSIVDLLT